MSQGDKCWYISNGLGGVVLEDGSLHFQVSYQLSHSFSSSCFMIVPALWWSF